MRAYYTNATATAIGPVGSKTVGAYLHKVIVGTGTATSVVTVYDGQDSNGTVVAVIDAGSAREVDFKGAWLKSGCYIQMTTAAAKVTAIIE